MVSRRGRSSRSLYRHVYDTLQDAVDDSRCVLRSRSMLVSALRTLVCTGCDVQGISPAIPSGRGQHCCRPGETILLESTAGDAPHVVSNVLINWPLHIVGGGATATDTVIEVHLSHTCADRHIHTHWALDAHTSLLHPLLKPWDSPVVLSKFAVRGWSVSRAGLPVLRQGGERDGASSQGGVRAPSAGQPMGECVIDEEHCMMLNVLFS